MELTWGSKERVGSRITPRLCAVESANEEELCSVTVEFEEILGQSCFY